MSMKTLPEADCFILYWLSSINCLVSNGNSLVSNGNSLVIQMLLRFCNQIIYNILYHIVTSSSLNSLSYSALCTCNTISIIVIQPFILA